MLLKPAASCGARRLPRLGISYWSIGRAFQERTRQCVSVGNFSTVPASRTERKSFTASTELLFHNTPVEPAGQSTAAYESLAKPDFFKDPASYSHPRAAFVDDRITSSSLHFADGSLSLYDKQKNRLSNVPGIWLRDNCSCSQCRNTDTAQRQINVLKGLMNCDIVSCEPTEDGTDGFIVEFGDGHRSSFPMEFLTARGSSSINQNRHAIVPITTWTAEIKSSPPTVPYTDVIAQNGLAVLLHQIRIYGFCFVENTPATPEATEALLSSIGPIRNTHYGGFYDFTADLSSKDTAYTSEHLDPHTDNTYFTEPAGLQALHLLSHTHEPSGGLSSLVDGFGAAQRLYTADRAAYLLLSRARVHAHASGNAGISIQPAAAFPTLNHDAASGLLTQVRWNNADRAGVDLPLARLPAWYAAAAAWEALLADVRNQFCFQLVPGRLLIFDNWRVLHGRSAFTGMRRMCGGYINRDDFISRYRMLNLGPEEVAKATVTG